MDKKIIISIIFGFILFAADAQDKNTINRDSIVMQADELDDEIRVKDYVNADSKEEKTDTALLFTKLPVSPDSVEARKKLKAFAYAGYLDSLLKTNQQVTLTEQPVSNEPGWLDNVLSSYATKIFFWTIAVIFILFILYRLFLTQGIFSRNVQQNKEKIPTAEEELVTDESDFKALIGLAVTNGNFRLAVRYQYLNTLYGLAAKNLISMAADKTNYQYVMEFSHTGSRNDFAALTLNYEYVWYGEFVIEEKIYRKIESGFLSFNKKMC